MTETTTMTEAQFEQAVRRLAKQAMAGGLDAATVAAALDARAAYLRRYFRRETRPRLSGERLADRVVERFSVHRVPAFGSPSPRRVNDR
jgi:hypothetical protein